MIKKGNAIFSLFLKPGLLFKDYSKREIGVLVSLFLMHILSVGLSFLVNFTAIRLAGVNLYGQYIYLFNILFILAGFCAFGADTLLIKTISVYQETNRYSHLKGVINYSIKFALLFSFAAALILKLLSKYSNHFRILESYESDILFFLILPMFSIGLIMQASLQGLKKPIYSQVTEKIVRPALLLLILGIFFIMGLRLSLFKLITINLVVVMVTILVSLFLLNRLIGSEIKKVGPLFEYKNWFRAAISFFILDILFILNSRMDIVLLGMFRSDGDIGIYNIVSKISDLSGFVLVTVNFVIAPIIANLSGVLDKMKLQQLITKSARFVLVMTLPLILILILFRSQILGLFNIHSFVGELALIILCFGQLVNVLFGSVGILLVMSGNQLESIWSLMVAISIGIILNLVLTPVYGILGTAIASSSSMIIWNLRMYLFVRKKLSIRTTAFGKF